MGISEPFWYLEEPLLVSQPFHGPTNCSVPPESPLCHLKFRRQGHGLGYSSYVGGGEKSPPFGSGVGMLKAPCLPRCFSWASALIPCSRKMPWKKATPAGKEVITTHRGWRLSTTGKRQENGQTRPFPWLASLLTSETPHRLFGASL